MKIVHAILFLLCVIPVFAVNDVSHTVEGTKVEIRYSGQPPFVINIRADDKFGQGGFVWVETYQQSAKVDMGFAGSGREYYYSVKDATSSWSPARKFILNNCSDLTKNQEETDVDCGGSCSKCQAGKACLNNGDCQSNNCESGRCSKPSRPIAMYTFDGNANDAIGNNHGTVYGAALTDGIKGQAYSFDGKDDYIDIGTGLKLETSFSVSAWIKSSNPNMQKIISTRTHRECNGWKNTNYIIDTTKDKTSFYFVNPSGSWQNTIASSQTRLMDNKWHNVVAVYSGNANKLYIDGIFTAAANNAGSPNTVNTVQTLIGTDLIDVKCNSGRVWFNGAIDDIAIYNYPLTDAEIQEIYRKAQEPGNTGTQSKTCSLQNGFICSESEYCPDNELAASDTNRCCSAPCLTPSAIRCSDCGKGLFNVCEQKECDDIGNCKFIPGLIAKCKEETCSDLIKNQGESDIDCGGSCSKCQDGKSCSSMNDCLSGYCNNNKCSKPTLKRTNSITQYGITWTFDKEYDYGQFVNGDYWVVGPVKIIKITPDYTKGRNGWQVNPSSAWQQGFDDRALSFLASLVPALPYDAKPGESLVKTISVTNGNAKTYVQTASILTVLTAAPPDNVFRPPYFGTAKPLYPADLKLELLPKLPSINGAISLASVEQKFKGPHISHLSNWNGDQIRPAESYQQKDPYGADISTDAAASILRLMLDDSAASKKQAAIYITQAGIDYYHMALGGTTWQADGGHGNGIKLPITFAAAILDNKEMKDFVSTAPKDGLKHTFGEDGMIYRGKNGKVLYGKISPWCTEPDYWKEISVWGSKTCRDPYGIIDGSPKPGDIYDTCCNVMPWKYTALSLVLMPELRKVWNNDQIIEFADRWVAHGSLTQQDPCAPVGQGGGALGNGECKLDPDLTPGSTFEKFSCQPGKQCGRFPERDGASKNYGYRSSEFGNEMWEKYR